jgi:hypothetical protein
LEIFKTRKFGIEKQAYSDKRVILEMRKIVLLIFMTYQFNSACAQLSFVEPAELKIVTDSFRILVNAGYPAFTDSVFAIYQGSRTKMTYSQVFGLYETNIHLVNVNDGDTITINVVKYVGETMASIQRKFIYFKPPVLLQYPPGGTVIKPASVLKVKFSSPDSCYVWVRIFSILAFDPPPPTLYFGLAKDSIDFQINTSVFKEAKIEAVWISVGRKESDVSTGIIIGPIYIDSCTNLTEAYTARQSIQDFNFGKLLTHTPRDYPYNGYAEPAIVDITSGKETIIPVRTESIRTGGLHQNGAVFSAIDSLNKTYIQKVYEWNRENLLTYEKYSLQASGNYAIIGGNLVRDLVSGINTTIPGEQNSSYVANNGNYVYVSKSSYNGPNEFYLNQNGVSKLFATIDGTLNPLPKTDGDKVVCFIGNGIYVHEEDRFQLLSQIGEEELRSTFFEVNNKYIAYVKPDALNRRQVWLRDPSGNNKQISFLPGQCEIESLNENGEIMFSCYKGGSRLTTQRYLAFSNGQILKIGSFLGKSYYRNSRWYVSVGRTLFTVDNSSPLPVKLLSFIANKAGINNRLVWTTAEEEGLHFFQVEHSSDGIAFKSLSKIAASGNAASYNFVHVNPIKGTNYYRLKAVDKDGMYSYSATRTINNSPSLDFKLFPNPARDIAQLQITADKKIVITISVLDLLGRTVLAEVVKLEPGTTFYALSTTSLQKGEYFVKVEQENKEATIIKFQKL